MLRRPAVTVLTHPFGNAPSLRNALASTRTFVRRAVYRRGHGPYAAYRSVIRGLRALGVHYNANPVLGNVGRTVVVTEGFDALRRAIEWKRMGRCSTLLALPIGDFPSDDNGAMLSPEIDACLMPSEWLYTAWTEDAPVLRDRMRIWAAGVEERYWVAGEGRKSGSRSVLVYWKTEERAFCQAVENLLRSCGWVPTTIRYGAHTQRQFRQLLSEAAFAVFISRSETQGIALAEAWSCDVPTLAWNPGELTYRGRRFSVVSSCPYLTRDTGREWRSLTDLERLLTESQRLQECAPRNWVLHHMTDEVRTRELLGIAKDLSR